MLFFRFLLLSTAGWMNRYQQRILDYIIEENRVLREQLDGRRLRFTNAQREALAKKAKPLRRSVLGH
jgi:hypothetical protein